MKNTYERLQLRERIDIEKMLAMQFSVTEIASNLNRNKGIISREIRKINDTYSALKYEAFAVGKQSDRRWQKSKIKLNPALKMFVYKHLKLRW